MNHQWRRNFSRVLAFFRKQTLDQELDAELASHLQMAQDELIAEGVEPEEARRLARLRLGGLGAIREQHRETRGLPFLDTLTQDLRHTARTLNRDRTFTIVAVLVLALGIGATATVFSVVDTVLLEPLPFGSPERLVWISNGPMDAGLGASGVSTQAPVFSAWRERSRSFEAMSGYFAFFTFDGYELLHADKATRLVGVGVEQKFFDVLEIQPLLGRFFVDEETQEDGPRAVILGHDLWRRMFQADPAIIGQAVILDNTPVTVVGVLPPTFDFSSVFAPGTHVDLLTPLNLDAMAEWGNTMSIVGRLRPGISAGDAERELTALSEQLQLERPELGVGYRAHVMPLNEFTGGSVRQGLLLLLGCVGAVLAIASANIAGLQLARTAKRRQEFAVRAALGAGRSRLIRQLLTEGMVLAMLSAALGTGLAHLGIRAVTHLPNLSLPLLQQVQLSSMTLVCIAFSTLIVGVACGLTPIFQASLSQLQNALRESARGTSAGGWQARARSGLVIAETALACMLLIAAMLLIRSFTQVLDVDLGFQPAQALTLNIEFEAELEAGAAKQAYFHRLRSGLEALPQVSAIGLTDALPLDRHRSWGVQKKGQNYPVGRMPSAFVSRVDPGFFEAMGITVEQGRVFSEDEAWQESASVVINKEMAEEFWPGLNPIGETFQVGLEDRTIIGVVANVHHYSLETAGGFDAYLPVSLRDGSNAFDLVIRTHTAPAAASPAIAAALQGVDRTLPTDGLRPLSWFVDRAVSSRRFVVSLLTGFAAFALLLASLGIYGVIAYTTGRRTQEIGIRMALGATGVDVLRRVLRDTMILAGIGVSVGACGAILLGKAMRSLLFEVSPNDPLSFTIMLAIMFVVTLIAGFIPAYRAARIEPGSTLRSP